MPRFVIVRRVSQFGVFYAVLAVERDDSNCDVYAIGAGRLYQTVASGFSDRADAESWIAARAAASI